jgi:TPR repeat protein
VPALHTGEPGSLKTMKREIIAVFLVYLAACSPSSTEMHTKAEQSNAAVPNKQEEYRISEGITRDYAEAMKWVRKAAEQGDKNAQYFLGMMYHKGEGVPLDYTEAAKWYRKAAEQGDAVAQLNLGWSYHNGEGVTRDYAEAVKWYSKAAEQGNAVAQNNLGWMYEEGKGVSRDYVTAYMWYLLATAQGQERAKAALDSIERKMTLEQISEAQKRALK